MRRVQGWRDEVKGGLENEVGWGRENMIPFSLTRIRCRMFPPNVVFPTAALL